MNTCACVDMCVCLCLCVQGCTCMCKLATRFQRFVCTPPYSSTLLEAAVLRICPDLFGLRAQKSWYLKEHGTCILLFFNTSHGFLFSFFNSRVLSPRNQASDTCVCTHAHTMTLFSPSCGPGDWTQVLRLNKSTWTCGERLTSPSEELDELSWERGYVFPTGKGELHLIRFSSILIVTFWFSLSSWLCTMLVLASSIHSR